jgi:hypothetical protein
MTAPTPGGGLTGSTYSSTAPEAELTMDLVDLWTIGSSTIPGYVEELVDALDKIMAALKSLELDWAGAGARGAHDINERWAASATALFGTEKNPGAGVLSRIAGGVTGAALNMNVAETEIVALWQKYIDLMRQVLASQDGGDTAAADHTPPISQV